MRTAKTAALLALALLAATSARAELAEGAVAPPIEGHDFLNIEPITLNDLLGRVVVVELFNTKSKPCIDQVKKLDELAEKYESRGVTVLAVTNEDRALVDAFAEQTKAKHPIVIESSDSAKNYGLKKGYPTTYVIGPDGKIAWVGNWADKAEDRIVVLITKVLQAPRLPARLKAVAASIGAGKYAEARNALTADVAAKPPTALEKPMIDRAMAWIDERLTKQLEVAVNDANAGRIYESAIALEKLATECKGLDVGAKAAEGLRQILADPVRKREVDAGKALDAAIASAKDQKPAKAIALYKAVVVKFKDTAAAKRATELITELGGK